MIGFLDSRSPDTMAGRLRAFREGLKEAGCVEGENVAIEYRWGEGRNDRMPSLIADLVRRRVSVIVTLESTLTALAAKKAASKQMPCLLARLET
jgi:putative tryptophan/tyrosine transport system substrate-binding protein